MALGLSLPRDIPWTRLCLSEDMIDRTVGDRTFPLRWRSSLTVFSYEPPAEDQVVDGQLVTYLKVVCSITGFQPDPAEVGLKDRKVDTSWSEPLPIYHFKDIASRYYGCYGAILEVSVAPKGSPAELAQLPLTSWPCFTDFEPKKRELYEIVSDTGEMMSRSLEDVNVRKGTTTTDSHEVVDIFGGASLQASAGEGKPGGAASVSGQWGTRDVSQEEYANVRTTDSGREQRETLSHTTQLTQMYHQLDSYHLGTNRAVFFLLPRPHVVQVETGLVNGPRLLEGIQEFLLVVARPAAVAGLCVEAYLETSHILSDPIYTYETDVAPHSLHISLQPRDTTGSVLNDSEPQYAEDESTFVPPADWEIDLDREGGCRIDAISGTYVTEVDPGGPRKGPPRILSVDRDHVTLWGQVYAEVRDRTWPQSNLLIPGRLDVSATVFLRKKQPTVTDYEQTVWLTGRGVSSCPAPAATTSGSGPFSESVVFERPAATLPRREIGGRPAFTRVEANEVGREIARQMRASLNHPARYPAGAVRFGESDMVARSVARLVRAGRHADNVAVTSLKDLDRTIGAKIARIAGRASRGRVLDMTLQETADRLGLSLQEAIRLRRAALGIEGAAPPAPQRWDRPGSGAPRP